MAVVYRHRRLDTNEIFYVGIGKDKYRPTSKKGRSNWWKNIVAKVGYVVEIVSKDLTWEEACEIEIYLIKYYGRRDLGLGNLVNMTDGGDGANGRISKYKGVPRTQEVIDKIKESMIGFSLTETQKQLQRDNTPKGETHPNYGKGYFMKGKKHSDETRKNMSGKIIICTITAKEYYTVRDCAEDNGLNRNTLKSRLNGFLKNNTTFKYKDDNT